MNTEKTGEFITKLRTENNLTQKELADRIGVTDKAVSKWETGRGFPDISVLEILARELGVSVTELINGERMDPDDPEKAGSQADSAVLETLRYVKQMIRKTVGIIVIIIGACLCFAPLVTAGAGSSVLFAIPGVLVILGGIFMITDRSEKAPRIVFELLSLAALAAAIVLELLPNGVVLWWAAPPGEPLHTTYHAYFDPTPFGLAHFSPLITSVLTVAAVILTILAFIIGKKHPKFCNAVFILIAVTAAISTCPVLSGFKYVTAIGVSITACLVLSMLFRAAANAKK